MPVVTDDQIVNLHSITGAGRGSQLYQFLPDNYHELTWTRMLRNPSKCTLVSPPVDDSDRLPDIVPWLHWISVWDGQETELLWSGPILKARASRRGLTVEARDIGALLRRTWTPVSRRWEAADPATIASGLWDAMIRHHGINVDPIVRMDPEGDRFDFQAVGERDMLDVVMDQLVQFGLRWAVTAGIPVLGPMPTTPVATLSETDFVGADIGVLRDGSASYNNVLVRGGGADDLARTKVPMHGLDLQTIVDIEDMFGVSNVARAAHQYARHTASIRTALDLPDGTVLDDDAPVTIGQLVPSTRYVLSAHGLRELVELEGVEVQRIAGKATAAVTMESVNTLPELADAAGLDNIGSGE